jgi:hypothetical protein
MVKLIEMGFLDFDKNEAMIVCDMSFQDIIEELVQQMWSHQIK